MIITIVLTIVTTIITTKKLSILAAKSTAAPMASPNITTAGSTKNTSSPRASSSVYDYKRRASSNSGVSNHEAQIKHAAQKLMSKDATVEVLRKIVTDLKERIEIVHTQEYANFLKYLFPAFKHILEKDQASNSLCHKEKDSSKRR